MNKSILIAAAIAVAAIFAGCDAVDFSAPDKTYQGDVKVKFTDTNVTLFAESEQDVQGVGVSTLRPISEARTYTFTVLEGESTTAEAGVHYTLESNSFTIPANQILGEIPITLIKANLDVVPTLELQITSDEAAAFNSTAVVTLRQFFPYVQADFLGEYTIQYAHPGGAIPPTVTGIAGDDENTVIYVDLLGNGRDFVFTLDDSDKTNFTASFSEVAAWQHPLGPVTVSGTGTFSAGDLTINMNPVRNVIPGVGQFAVRPMNLTKN